MAACHRNVRRQLVAARAIREQGLQRGLQDDFQAHGGWIFMDFK